MAGTGIEVWEVIAAYKSMKGDFKRLQKAYHWLSGEQLKTALGYYMIYPQEIDRLIERMSNGMTRRFETVILS